MTLHHYIDFEVPAFGEFAGSDVGGGGASIAQGASYAFPDRGSVGMRFLRTARDVAYANTPVSAPAAGAELWLGFWAGVNTPASGINGVVNRFGSAPPAASDAAYSLFWNTRTDGSFATRCYDDTGTYVGTPWTPTYNAAGWNYWILGARRESTASSADGAMWLYYNGVLVATTSNVQNYAGLGSITHFVAGSDQPRAANLSVDIDEIKIGTSYADVQPTAATPSADTPCAERTLVVARSGNADSEAFAQYYAAARGVPLANIVRVPCTGNESLADYATFQSEVETPLSTWLGLNTEVAANITTLLLGYGVPGRFDGGAYYDAAASRLIRLGASRASGTVNPLYDADGDSVQRITRAVLDGAGSGVAYLVTRIDAVDLATAKALVDRSVALDGATLAGEGYLDPYGIQGAGYEDYEDLLESWGASLAAQRLKQTINLSAASDPGSNVAFDELTGDDWFFGWHSTTGSAGFFGTQGDGSRALFYDGDSFSCQTLRSVATSRWCPLAIAAGYALTAGPVDEPFVTANLAPAPLLEALRLGYTFAEAWIQATLYIDHRQIAVGDPLATLTFPAAGYHIYRGRRVDAIDFTQPAAAAPVGSTEVRLPSMTWAAGPWCVAIRAVDDAGIEFADPTAILRFDADEFGRLTPTAPLPVRSLTARATAGERVTLGWRTNEPFDPAGVARYEIFLAASEGLTVEGQIAAGSAASISADNRPAHEWTSEPLTPGVAHRVIVRAVADSGAVGRAAITTVTPQASAAVAIQSLTAKVK